MRYSFLVSDTMSQSISAKGLTLAWAVQVSLAQLGASVTAYVDTKATNTTFRLIVKYTLLKPLRALSEEILIMIAGQLRHMEYSRNMDEWVRISNCLVNTCAPEWHLSQEQVEKVRNDGHSMKLSEEHIQETLAVRAKDWHQMARRRYESKLRKQGFKGPKRNSVWYYSQVSE